MRIRPASIVILSLLLPACAGTPTPQTTPPPDPTDALKELGEVYKYRASLKQPPPARLDDLSEHQAVLANAWPLVEGGDVVVVWKAGYSPASTDVLAYEKAAAAAGGKVLLRNGAVKQLTADEFRAAKK